jgi:hypothetical protein
MNHRLVVRTGRDEALLDFTSETENGEMRSVDQKQCPWREPFQLGAIAFTCRQLRTEANAYLEATRASRLSNAILYLSYPLGLLATRAMLPGLLWSAGRVVVAGFYDPWATEKVDNRESEEPVQAEESEEPDPPLPLPRLSLVTYESAARVMDELVDRLVNASVDGGEEDMEKEDEEILEKEVDGEETENDEEEDDMDLQRMMMSFMRPILEGGGGAEDILEESGMKRMAKEMKHVEEMNPLTLRLYVTRGTDSRRWRRRSRSTCPISFTRITKL